MNEDLIKSLQKILETINAPVCLAIQTDAAGVVLNNHLMVAQKTKERQSIGFCLLYNIINTLNDADDAI